MSATDAKQKFKRRVNIVDDNPKALCDDLIGVFGSGGYVGQTMIWLVDELGFHVERVPWGTIPEGWLAVPRPWPNPEPGLADAAWDWINGLPEDKFYELAATTGHATDAVFSHTCYRLLVDEHCIRACRIIPALG